MSTGTLRISRNGLFSGLLAAVAAAVALAYLVRATGDTGGWADWLLCVLMTGIALIQFVALADARTPLAIADEEGVRLRLGPGWMSPEWVGLPWLTISQVITEQRDLPWPEGRLVIVPRHPAHVLDQLSAGARREIRWQRRLHGAALSVPLSLFTRSSSSQLSHDLKTLAAGRAEVVGLRGRERARLDAQPVRERGPEAAESKTGPGGGIGSAEHVPVLPEQRSPAPRFDPVAAIRAARSVMRADVVRDQRPRIVPHDQAPLPVSAPAAAEAAPIKEPGPEAVIDPVIGPQVAAARGRAGLSVDQLSERTRIRPHVLEAIEVDDFGPCGGDFYARGHLGTLARYLGLDAAELTRLYDDHYAAGPINARRVFEAELATGLSGGMRATASGPRWTLLIGAALSLTMIWGVARYFTEEPARITSTSIGDSAGLSANREPITSPLTTTAKVTVRAVEVPVRVRITDRSGEQLFQGRVEPGEKISVVGVGPFEIRADKAGHARVWLNDKTVGTVGQGQQVGHRRIG